MAVTTRYWYDGTDLIYEEDQDTMYREYYRGPEGLLGMYDNSGAGRLLYFYDGIGSTSEVTYQDGTEVGTYTYDAFGVPLSPGPDVTNPFRYIGKHGYYYGAADSMYLLQQRYYRAGIGRFWTRDPLRDRDDRNPYRYARNRPTGVMDPSGLKNKSFDELIDENRRIIDETRGNCRNYCEWAWSIVKKAISNPSADCRRALANASLTLNDIEDAFRRSGGCSGIRSSANLPVYSGDTEDRGLCRLACYSYGWKCLRRCVITQNDRGCTSEVCTAGNLLHELVHCAFYVREGQLGGDRNDYYTYGVANVCIAGYLANCPEIPKLPGKAVPEPGETPGLGPYGYW